MMTFAGKRTNGRAGGTSLANLVYDTPTTAISGLRSSDGITAARSRPRIQTDPRVYLFTRYFHLFIIPSPIISIYYYCALFM